eukprot:8775-Amphidinium_carterae.1
MTRHTHTHKSRPNSPDRVEMHLVADQYDGDVLAHSHYVAVPVRHIFVGDARSHIEHDDGTLTLSTLSQASMFGHGMDNIACIPHCTLACKNFRSVRLDNRAQGTCLNVIPITQSTKLLLLSCAGKEAAMLSSDTRIPGPP